MVGWGFWIVIGVFFLGSMIWIGIVIGIGSGFWRSVICFDFCREGCLMVSSS